MAEELDIKHSKAFEEYRDGRKERSKLPRIIIILLSILYGISSALLAIFFVWKQPSGIWLDFILYLFGVPAGFIVALVNDRTTLYEEMKDGFFSSIIYAITFFPLTLLLYLVASSGLDESYTLGGIVFGSLMVVICNILFSFVFGAVLAHMFVTLKENWRKILAIIFSRD